MGTMSITVCLPPPSGEGFALSGEGSLTGHFAPFLVLVVNEAIRPR